MNWFLRHHRILWTQPRTTWHAWRYWRRFGRITRRDRATLRAAVTDQRNWPD